MAHIYADRVKETASNKPNAATAFNLPDTGATGYRSFDSVLASADTCIYGAENGTDWEVGLGTFTAGSPDTLARTTILSSSTGSAIDFSAGADVSVYITADASALRNGFLRSKASSADAAVTGEVGTMHVLDISGFGANRNFTLPAAVAGDRIGVTLSAGDATYALICIGDTGITINSGSAATEWSRLFISSETVIFRATSASNWVVETDGRVPCSAVLTLASDSDSTTTNTWQLPTATTTAGSWTENRDIGNCMDHANGKFTCRRAGTYQTLGRGSSNAALTDGVRWAVMIHKNNTTTVAISTVLNGAGGQLVQTTYGGLFAMVETDYAEFKWLQGEASRGCNIDSTFTVQEII